MSGDIPPEAGSYGLHLYLRAETCLCIGRLGTFWFPAGHYFYLGSAQGSGGLRARLGRYLRGAERPAPHWHVDWLRQAAELRGYGYRRGAAVLECAWSRALAAWPGAQIVAPRFGASDCRSGCPAHLVHFPNESGPAFENGLKWKEFDVWRHV